MDDATILMKRGYQRFVHRYHNSKIRVAKTCYPYGMKFCSLYALVGNGQKPAFLEKRDNKSMWIAMKN